MTEAYQDVRWSGRHAIVTMPDEIDLTNSGDLNEPAGGGGCPSLRRRLPST